ncbi:PQQ-dependent dehydrogenase, methanol/ethanol family [Novosphingobium rosa]|uniref:PQQ-dependent dehydrogenase, methanol/ethanol family n=1 Tax=Novosphingobium rosa TaxID=76978 RepID=UPI00082B3039|nr:PQQ-dependent dehydrogenase, methanol/ethanol family [Novosphingobium rosa]
MRRSVALLTLALLGASPLARDVDWPGYGGPGENHYSPLDQINAGNVSQLGLAWFKDINDGGSALSAPVEVGGVLYFASGISHVRAVDAVSGRELWDYDAETAKVAGHKMRAAWGIRGLAYDNGRIFFGTLDGRLIALDARTGHLAWQSQTVGKDDERYISGPPWVFKGKVIIGHGGADFAPIRGYVTAYDQQTGKQLWRFYTVPGDPAKGFENKAMEMAAKTWTGQWWKYGGGGTAWNAMAYDPRFNRIYIGIGNGSPWNRKIRSPGGGDNLFLCSIVALDADTGAYVWHYQTNPGESWDYNSAMDIELTDMTINGQKRPVLMHAPKNGFVYVIDRETGKLISARNIVPVNWAKGIDQATGRPIENPEARYPDGKPAIVYPSPFGAHNIEAMSYNPSTGLLYIPAMDQGRVYVDPAGGLAGWRHLDGQRLSTGTGAPPPGVEPDRAATSFLLAWNPQTQSEAWRIPMPGIRGGGGTASTGGGLLFEGNAGGHFIAYAATDGKKLWSFDAQTSVMAQPITYSVKGRQYVSVIAGSRFPSASGLPHEWNYRSQQWRLLTFALGGKAQLPKPEPMATPVLDDAGFAPIAAKVAAGNVAFAQRCSICHGAGSVSGGAAPDLGQSPIAMDAAAFRSVLHDGLLAPRGMPQFEELSDAEIEDLRHYIRQRARERLAASPAPTVNRGLHEGQ